LRRRRRRRRRRTPVPVPLRNNKLCSYENPQQMQIANLRYRRGQLRRQEKAKGREGK